MTLRRNHSVRLPQLRELRMDLHPLARRFNSVAESYEYGRPEYPPAVAGALGAELGLRPGDSVLDLGAGTGKLTRALLVAAFEVTALEPQQELRAILAARAGSVRVLDGVAEELPFPDGAFAAVTVADAFHWFDRPRALREVARVLRPGGGLAILDKEPDWTVASWGSELRRLIGELRPAHPHFDDRPWQDYVRDANRFSEPWIVEVTAPVALEPARVLAHVASMSWIAAMPEPRRTQTLDHVQALMRDGRTPATMPLHVEIGLARRAD